ncbi:PepSY domain-containing protein [Erythrobacter mangrovi]|uniref:PepSY domain-containing protein n=1 Tax=Erythrobacter mangrovi TaxID=2739433 RepID=A0A7D3XBH5_9SPHN|nr:PepSY domain-containing protein [Erythrobacter mangrovi]QKG71180.1 PepSY domain-containing protein [Erythrobacter mangrovi]
MKRALASILAFGLVATPLLAEPAFAQQRSEQGEARREMNAGNIMPLRQIEARVLPTMKGAEYLGPAYDPAAMAYRLKFIRDGRVLFVDVDARTGRILRRSN